MEQEDQLESIFQVGLDDHSKQSMRTAITWAMVTGITGFLSLLLISISNIQTLNALSSMRAYGPANSVFAIYVLFTIFFTVLAFLLNFFMIRFSSRTKQGLETEDSLVVDNGIRDLNNYVVVMAIVVIIIIAVLLYAFAQNF